ncbi:bifunctional hydroxymethylpyrimidine kinase/phosphomethylpyrimidine kinase [Acidianus brierleyi]|uniref:Bifunctional hydroxymethylpyrimidine kinase/phosphomethylpyrimidine kinase n=1 Tax=Acidianus brierleyi TaxID=41673 RepID=A0A2U9IE56_9CREN|nr:bifunctional hydroxymethylpyrimidine kinase/phosphomethylpyrimidine kinase [Acidianus brierleyi]AWR94270.1 bifunctional hydroxymethylpyrimidine kinase/phosphomethylpyrimidine kinase [Acidianus brierleyi]
MRTRPVAITIAGSDSGGGAGLQADLKTFTSLGVFGATIVTGLTAQNTIGVSKIYEVSPEFVEAQFDSVINDLKPKYAKTGMLASKEIINIVKKKILEYKLDLVLDPVMIAKSGDLLVKEDVIPSIKDLIKNSIIATPNKFEAEKILGGEIKSAEDLKIAAKNFYNSFSTNVVIKGGSKLGGMDYAIIDGEELELTYENVNTKNTHGSGDVFSAAITAYLAKGYSLKDAVINAKQFVSYSIKYSLDLGNGHGPVDPFAYPESIIEREISREIAEKLVEYLETHKDIVKKLLDQEEKLNIGVGTAYGDIATLAGGIIRYINWIKVDGPIVINYYDNLVTSILKETNKKIGISFSMSNRILSASEKGLIKISESGINSDTIIRNGKIILVADDLNDLIKKIEMITND